MGEHQVDTHIDEKAAQEFMQAMLTDLQALELMLEEGVIEKGVRRIGAEQEMFIIDSEFRPSTTAQELIEKINDPRFTTEIGLYNVEANLTPQDFDSDCLKKLEGELMEVVDLARRHANDMGNDIALTGILPTIKKTDLVVENMTPMPRYHEMNENLKRIRKGDFLLRIEGVDDLRIAENSVMLESAATSFQIHFQVGAEEFAKLYNVAQLVTAPVLAASVNSPTLLGHRLWKETRIAVFQGSVDTRTAKNHDMRGHRPRVHFGNDWAKDSVLTMFRDDVARYRLLLTKKMEENALDVFKNGGIPKLDALRLHNSTIWRWNRPCYGIGNGKPHLRIEHRVLPSGPTVIDQMANAAFFFGLMASYTNRDEEVSELIDFSDVKANFFRAAQHGLAAQFQWIDGNRYSAQDLILTYLLPIAREGLLSTDVNPEDADRYLGVLQNRVESGKTGSQWFLGSLANVDRTVTSDLRYRSVMSDMLEQQRQNKPVHEWPLADLQRDASDWKKSYKTIGQFMTTDLLTVRPEDPVSLAASVMDWENVRHLPVEDENGKLLGIVSHRSIIRMLTSRKLDMDAFVKDLMRDKPVTVTPDTSSLEAIELMKQYNVGCLPVIEEGKLVGIITEQDFIFLAAKLLEEYLKEDQEK